jgi:hypothetical protein
MGVLKTILGGYKTGTNQILSFLSGNISPTTGMTANAAYGLNPTAQQQSDILKYPQLSDSNYSNVSWSPSSNYPSGTANKVTPGNFPSSGGGGGGGGQVQQQSQPQQGGGDPYAGMDESAKSQAQVELEQALQEYDYNAGELNAQSGQLDTQRLSSLGTIDTEAARAQKEGLTAKEEATSATQSAQGKALSTAQDVQRTNRNVLRALGILSSSAAGEMLSKPMTEYGKQAGDLQQGLVKRLAVVEDWLMKRTEDFAKVKTDLEAKYTELKDNISRDLRFNDRQRITAVKAAGAALSQRLADIKVAAANYQVAAKNQSDNMLLQLAQLKMYQNPSADVSSIFNTLLSQVQQNNNSGVGALPYQQEEKKDIYGNPISNTLSGSAQV